MNIDIRQLRRPADVGRWVHFEHEHMQASYGRIKAWNETSVFVVYHCADEWERFDAYTGEGTLPEDLTFVEGTVYLGNPREIQSRFCEQCGSFVGPFKMLKKDTTLGHPLHFMMCLDIDPCYRRFKAKMDARPHYKAEITDLYPAE